jgi:hypothetical protein
MDTERIPKIQEIAATRTVAAYQYMVSRRYNPLEELIDISNDAKSVGDTDKVIAIAKLLMPYHYPSMKNKVSDEQSKELQINIRNFTSEKSVPRVHEPDFKVVDGELVPLQDRDILTEQSHPDVIPE